MASYRGGGLLRNGALEGRGSRGRSCRRLHIAVSRCRIVPDNVRLLLGRVAGPCCWAVLRTAAGRCRAFAALLEVTASFHLVRTEDETEGGRLGKIWEVLGWKRQESADGFMAQVR